MGVEIRSSRFNIADLPIICHVILNKSSYFCLIYLMNKMGRWC